MTEAQFKLITRLIQGKPGTPANDAAFMVLCQGLAQADAMRLTKASRQTISDAVKRFGDIHRQLIEAYGSASSLSDRED